MKPEVWFAIPSANVGLCRKNLPAWRDMGYRTAVYQGRERGDVPADIVVWSDTYNGWADAVNTLCLSIVPATTPIVVTGGDDMLPDPTKRAGEIGEEFLEHFKGSFGVMQPHGDEFLSARSYCGSPWIGREWFTSMYGGRGAMWPGYRHNWADNEIFWLARCFDALWERPDLSHFHDHFSRHGGEMPEYWKENSERRDRADLQLFIARSWQRFPGHEPIGPRAGARFDAARFEREYRGFAEICWITKYGLGSLAASGERRLRAALDRCAAAGRTTVALYGAGTHTRAIGSSLMEPPVRIRCIIDDNAELHGRSLWGFPIVSVAQALTMNLDAVVLSSNSMEDKLRAAAQPLARAGVEIISLYENAVEDPTAEGVAAA